ncbi:hypothetical protein JCM16303_002541 [Sporobolomyces ruberrimus]
MTSTHTLDSQAPTSTVDKLPPELWHTIILEFALPPRNSFKGTLERQRTLARCSRISRSFSWLQQELFSQVRLETYQRCRKLVDTFDRDETLARDQARSPRLAQMVKTLRIGHEFESLDRDQDGGKFNLEGVIPRCPNLKDVFLGRLSEVRAHVFFTCPKLVSLYIWDCDFNPSYWDPPSSSSSLSSSPPSLPSLLHLTALDVETRDHYNELDESELAELSHHFLSRSLCPRLTALNVDTLESTQSTLYYSSNRPLTEHLLGPIIFLSCSIEHLRPPEYLPTNTSVPTLVSSRRLFHLPSTLESLRITSGHFFSSKDFLTPFFSRYRGILLPHLKELILPMKLKSSAGFEGLRDWAREERIEVRWERDEESPGTVWDQGFWKEVERIETERRARGLGELVNEGKK